MGSGGFLDCCRRPGLGTVRTICEESHQEDAVMRCRNCGAYWFYRWLESMNFSGGDDEISEYYTRLTPEEARAVLDAAEPDLGFLLRKPCICKHEGGVVRTDGQPDHPF